MSTDAERKEQKRLKSVVYEQNEFRKEKKRHDSMERYRQKKMITTASRFEEHSLEDLLIISALRCRELKLDFVTHEKEILHVMRLLHGPRNDQRATAEHHIVEPQANQSTAQESRAL